MTRKMRQEAASASKFFDHTHLTVIAPESGWRKLDLRELWAYRELLRELAARDVRVRYKQTVLGATWAVLRPLLTAVIFTVIFGRLAKVPSEGFPYAIWVYAALVPWTFFSSAVAASAQSLVGSSALVSKVYFPRLIIPLSSIGTAIIDLLVSTAVLVVLMAYYRVGWTTNLLSAPLLFVALLFTTLGFGTLLAALTVSYRDVSHILPFALQIWLYLTPVIYPLSFVPDRWRWLVYLNPLTGLSEAFRSAFLGKPFDLAALSLSALISAALLALGVAYFERVERRFADVI